MPDGLIGPRLRGRRRECDTLDELVADLRSGHSRVLVMRGEAGVGKTALLDYLGERSVGCRIVCASGVESEMELAFAGLHQLSMPMLDRRDRLPDPQRAALGTAFGLEAGPVPDRFLVGLAMLGLLSEVAREQPLVCLVDDAQWLDRASAQALAFVARRLLAESVALVFVVREPAVEQDLDGLPDLAVRGLSHDDARALLEAVIPGRLDDRVRDRIIAETRGNPLALLELPRGLSAAELAGGFGRPDAQPLASRIEQSFVRRLDSLPAATRTLLLAAAAEPLGDVTLLWRAAANLGIGGDAAAPAEAAGLIELGARVRFRHPLVRAAVYRSAPVPERRDAHRRWPRRPTPRPIRTVEPGIGPMRPQGLTRTSLPSSSGLPPGRRPAAACRRRPRSWRGRPSSRPTLPGAGHAPWRPRAPSSTPARPTTPPPCSPRRSCARSTVSTAPASSGCAPRSPSRAGAGATARPCCSRRRRSWSRSTPPWRARRTTSARCSRSSTSVPAGSCGAPSTSSNARSARAAAGTVRGVEAPERGGARFGVTGLAVMGANLARNVARHGIPVAVHNRTTARTERFMADHGGEGPITGTESVADFVAALDRPRQIMVMVKAGAPVDAVIAELVPHLEPGDTILDGGNSFFRDTQRRTRELADRGLRFLGVGVSGGEEGALAGPSIMPGGDRAAYDDVAGVLTTIAAQVDGTPCCTYVGPDGAGHYVKMVHNGIEYADIQLITEAYDLLRHVVGLPVPEIAATFERWNGGDLESYLIEITAIVLAKTDEATGGPLVDVILDRAEQKGTGRWTAQDALELGVPLTAITEAVFARSLSALGGERATAAERLVGPRPDDPRGAPGGAAAVDASFVDDVHRALFASKVVAYAQGFDQLAAASATEGWHVDLGQMATIWRGGCIIRAAFLDRIREAYEAEPDLQNLLFAGYFGEAIAGAQDSWRRVVSVAAERGVAVPAFSSALAWYDGYRRERGPASLIQGLRDYFGAHTYQRVDREGSFHTRWPQDGREIATG